MGHARNGSPAKGWTPVPFERAIRWNSFTARYFNWKLILNPLLETRGFHRFIITKTISDIWFSTIGIESIDIQSAKKVLSEISWSQDMNKCGMAKSSKCRCNICLPFFITADISISFIYFTCLQLHCIVILKFFNAIFPHRNVYKKLPQIALGGCC